MDASDLHSLFSVHNELKKYVTKDLVTDDPDGRQGNHTTNITFTCKTFTSQLLQWGEGFLIFKGHLERAAGGNWADDSVVGIQNGTNTLFTSVKVSMNDTEVEHNRRADFGTFVNLLEYSPDYASSIATQSGFARDIVTTPRDADDSSHQIRASVVGAFDNGTHQVALHCYVPLKNISQFFRRLSFPIVNQKFQLQLDLNINGCIRRADGVQDGRLVYESCQLYVPRVELPIELNTKLYKAIESGNFVKTLNWDMMDPMVDSFNITVANRNFNFLLTNGKQAISKMLFFVHNNFNSQQHSRFMTNFIINNINITINDKDYFNMLVDDDYVAYKMLLENFNMMGSDYNTGSVIPYSSWKTNTRIYCVDTSRLKELEANPSADMKIRLRGSVTADGQLIVVMFQEKTTRIDFANPNNTQTTINVV